MEALRGRRNVWGMLWNHLLENKDLDFRNFFFRLKHTFFRPKQYFYLGCCTSPWITGNSEILRWPEKSALPQGQSDVQRGRNTLNFSNRSRYAIWMPITSSIPAFIHSRRTLCSLNRVPPALSNVDACVNIRPSVKGI